MNEQQVTVCGKEGIRATIIADQVNRKGHRLTTYELEYNRIFLSELNTHRMLSKNSASSRAIPFPAVLQLLQENPAMPVFWGKNIPGMKAREELSPVEIEKAKQVWLSALDSIISHSKELFDLGLHKQILNRLGEPWQRMKTVMTGTEYENLFWLRDHNDAQPEFHELARCMKEARCKSIPRAMYCGDWHLPYVSFDPIREVYFREDSGEEIPIETALKVSASCCAQVSYRKLDDTVEKALMIYEKLIDSDPPHCSPVEHQGTPISLDTVPFDPSTWQDGITHVKRDGSLWSGNLQGWVQYRQTLNNHTMW